MNAGIYDIIIIGGGPAGLTAGLYASRGRMKTLLIESMSVMGQASMTELIENYPGVEKATGFDLISTFKKQAQSFGLECAMGTVKALSASVTGGQKTWKVIDENGEYHALAVVIASGARPKKLGVPGEVEMTGKGVSYCATCDAAFFRDKEILVVGGGDTAVEEALFLTRFGKKVTLVHRRDRLRATKIVQERAFSCKKMEFIWESVVESINGSAKVESVTVKNVKTGGETDVACDGVFVFVGWQPNTDFIDGIVDLDKGKAIITGASMNTSRPGIFAAGDCCSKVLHQVVTACGDGATAAYSAQQYVEELKGVAYN